MAVHLRVLLILSGFTGIHSITTVSEVSVKAGSSISIPCLYGLQYISHVKYLCKGFYWHSCSYIVKTNQQNSGRFSISDDNTRRIFTVTINDLADEDTDYWCAVEINGGADVKEYFHLSVTGDTPHLYVDHQEITRLNGDNLTINCYYTNTGETKWCRLGISCVTRSSGSIDGTKVTISEGAHSVFNVTMSGLRTESSGWYWCAKGDLKMPVHVTVTETPTTTTIGTRHLTTLSPTPNHILEDGQQSAYTDPKSLIISLSLLISIVMVALLIWFMLRRHKQTKAESSATTTMDDHVQNKLVEWDLGDLLSTFEDRHIALLLLPVVTPPPPPPPPPRHLQNPEKDGPPQLRRIYKSFHRQRTTCLPSSRRWWPPLCHNTATADCFYALSLNVAQSKRMRDFRQALTPTVPSPESPEASTTRKRSHNPDSSSSSEDKTPVPYQESGTSGLEEEREFIARLQNAEEELTYSIVKHKTKTSSQAEEEETQCNVGNMRKTSSQRSESDVEVEAEDKDVTYSTLAQHHQKM